MNNYMLIGVGNFTNFNLRLCLGVITFFSVVTIVSYIVEVNDTGSFWYSIKHATVNRRLRRSPGDNKFAVQNLSTVVTRYANLSQEDARKEDKSYSTTSSSWERQEAASTFPGSSGSRQNEASKGSKNVTIPAFNVAVRSKTGHDKSKLFKKGGQHITRHATVAHHSTKSRKKDSKLAINGTHLVFYMNDPVIVPFIDCLKNTYHSGLQLERNIRNFSSTHFDQLLFVGPSGNESYCKKSLKPCKKYFILSHPVSRLATLYNLCKVKKLTTKICRAEHFHSNMTLHDFARVQDGVLFRYLLARTKMCEASSKNDFCRNFPRKMQKFSSTAFQKHLKLVFEDIIRFSGIGLMEHRKITKLLFQKHLAVDLQKCNNRDENAAQNLTKLKEYHNDSRLMKYFTSDLEIYYRFEQIFSHHRHTLLNVTAGSGPTLTTTPYYHKKGGRKYDTKKVLKNVHHGVHKGPTGHKFSTIDRKTKTKRKYKRHIPRSFGKFWANI